MGKTRSEDEDRNDRTDQIETTWLTNYDCAVSTLGGLRNGTLDTACLLERVEKISDNGKMIFKLGDHQLQVNTTFTLISVDSLTDDGVRI